MAEQDDLNNSSHVFAKWHSKAEEINAFAQETKMRKMLFDLIKPNIISSTDVMMDTKVETEILSKKVQDLEKVCLSSLPKYLKQILYFSIFSFPLIIMSHLLNSI